MYSMSTSWLREYVLGRLGIEIRNASHSYGESAAAKGETAVAAKADQARLVYILDRGQAGMFEDEISHSRKSRKSDSARRPLHQVNYWWDATQRGSFPSLENHTNAWLLVSDGISCARVYLTVEALREMFDWDNENNNEDTLFGRGCCILLKKYSFECNFLSNKSNSEINHYKIDYTIDHRRTVSYQHIGCSAKLKVSSLEPKSGFNNHCGTTLNHANHNHDNNETIISPVLEDLDVLYGLHFLARKRLELSRNFSLANNSGIPKKMMNRSCIEFDWDIAFGRLNKGMISISTATVKVSMDSVESNMGLYMILELAEEAALSELLTREWEEAKKEYGIAANHGVNEPTELSRIKTAQQYEYFEASNQGGEDISRMYIQNVLARSEDDESKDGRDVRTQNEFQKDDYNLTSDSNNSLLPVTQPKIPLAMIVSTVTTPANTKIIGEKSIAGIAAATGLKTPGENKTIASNSNNTNDDRDDNERLKRRNFRIERSDNVEKISCYVSVEAVSKKRYKRPRGNSFGSGMRRNLTLDEAISCSGSSKMTMSQTRLWQQQLLIHQEQEGCKNRSGIWDSIQEQLLQPSHTAIHCVPSDRTPSGSGRVDDIIAFSPNRSSLCAHGNIKNSGSTASLGTTSSSPPNPASGAYYRKYGLSRWLSQNIINDEKD